MKLLHSIFSASILLLLAVLLWACDLTQDDDPVFAGKETKTLTGKITYQSIVTGELKTPKSIKVAIPNLYTGTFDTDEFKIEFVNKQTQMINIECYEMYGTDTIKYRYNGIVKKDSDNLGTILLQWDDSKAIIRARVVTDGGVPLPSFSVCLFAGPDEAETSQSCSGALANAITNKHGYVLFTSIVADKTYGLRAEGTSGTKMLKTTSSITPSSLKVTPTTRELEVEAFQKIRASVTFHNLLTDRTDSPDGATFRFTQTGSPATNPPVIYEGEVKNGMFDVDVPSGNYDLTIKYIQTVGNEKLTYIKNEPFTGSATGYTDLKVISLNLTDATSAFAPIEVRFKTATGALMPSFSVCLFPDLASANSVTDCTGALSGSVVPTNNNGYVLITGLSSNVNYAYKSLGVNGNKITKGVIEEQVSGISQRTKVTIVVD